MTAYPMLPLWHSDYLADTYHLSMAEHGAYFLMLMAAWRDSNCEIPADDHRLAKVTRSSYGEWLGVKENVMDFWRPTDKGLTIFQPRLSKEKRKAMDRSEKARRSAERRWNKTNGVTQFPARGGCG